MLLPPASVTAVSLTSGAYKALPCYRCVKSCERLATTLTCKAPSQQQESPIPTPMHCVKQVALTPLKRMEG
jgi:hypothetical protein